MDDLKLTDEVIALLNVVTPVDVDTLEAFVPALQAVVDAEVAKALRNRPDVPAIIEILAEHRYGTGGKCLSESSRMFSGCGFQARRAERYGALDKQHRAHLAEQLAAWTDDQSGAGS